MIRINFVCLGNICRSPFAEALARAQVAARGWSEKFLIDSCGTSNEHEGDPSHPLSRRVGKELGLVMEHRARPFRREEFGNWDYILAMDTANLRHLKRLAPDNESANRLALLLSWHPAPGADLDVPDPWGRGVDAYYSMRDLIDAALGPFLDHLGKHHRL